MLYAEDDPADRDWTLRYPLRTRWYGSWHRLWLEAQIGRAVYHRIRIGQFVSRAEAKAAAERLALLG